MRIPRTQRPAQSTFPVYLHYSAGYSSADSTYTRCRKSCYGLIISFEEKLGATLRRASCKFNLHNISTDHRSRRRPRRPSPLRIRSAAWRKIGRQVDPGAIGTSPMRLPESAERVIFPSPSRYVARRSIENFATPRRASAPRANWQLYLHFDRGSHPACLFRGVSWLRRGQILIQFTPRLRLR